MKKLVATIAIGMSLASVANAKVTPIAQCGETSGYSYYPAFKQEKTLREKAAELILGRPMVPDSWITDGYKNSTLTLVQSRNGNLDLLIYNAPRKETFSTVEDGGKLHLVRNSHEEIVVVAIYASVIVIYTFFKTKEGNKVSILSSKNGMAIGIRTSLFTGSCNFVNFNNIKETY